VVLPGPAAGEEGVRATSGNVDTVPATHVRSEGGGGGAWSFLSAASLRSSSSLSLPQLRGRGRPAAREVPALAGPVAPVAPGPG